MLAWILTINLALHAKQVSLKPPRKSGWINGGKRDDGILCERKNIQICWHPSSSTCIVFDTKICPHQPCAVTLLLRILLSMTTSYIYPWNQVWGDMDLGFDFALYHHSPKMQMQMQYNPVETEKVTNWVSCRRCRRRSVGQQGWHLCPTWLCLSLEHL